MNSSATSLRRAWPYDEAMAGRRPSSRTQPAVGKRLALARQRKGITQAELAELLGVSQSLVAHYETRATNPQLSFLENAAAVLNTSVAELIGEEPVVEQRKPGPRSQLDERIARVRLLPKKKQELVVRMIDAILDEERTTA